MLGESSNSPQTDIEIITLSQVMYEEASLEAWQDIVDEFETNEPDEIDRYVDELADRLLHEKYAYAKEFIEITENRIRVGLNAERIGNREVDRACIMLLEVESFTPGTYLEFGEKVNVTERTTN